MRYILAILCPPLTLLLNGRIYSALLNIALGILWLDNLAGGPFIWRHIQNLPAPALAVFPRVSQHHPDKDQRLNKKA